LGPRIPFENLLRTPCLAHDVYRYSLPRYRGPGRPNIGMEPSTLMDARYDDARGNVVDHRADALAQLPVSLTASKTGPSK
jgi:hypothetical protein